MRRAVLAFSFILVTGCEGGVVGGDPTCANGVCDPQTDPNEVGTSPLPTTLSTCTTDAECTAPYVCNTKVSKCVPPSSKNNGPCDPIDSKACPDGQQCIAGVCMTPPGGCQNNEDCPVGFICQNGVCNLDGGGGPGCKSNTDCPGQVCVSGQCKPEAACKIAHSPDRMKGNWRLDSMLHVRDGLQGFTKGLLTLAATLQDIIDGKFTISGIPAIFSTLIQSLVQNLISQYVPPWGKQTIQLLADINAVITDMRVISIETIQALGSDQYVGYSTWKVVEFTYKGVTKSTAPDAIPGMGKVTTDGYSAREVCGVFYIDKHKVKNAIGKIFRWAIEAVVTAVSCSLNNVPCYKDLPSMINDVVDCPKLAAAVAQQNQGQIAGLEALVLTACTTAKATFVTQMLQELDDLALKMTYMSLAAKADIGNKQLVNGRWYGVLGDALSKGNFEGTFTGQWQSP
jgi:hypothetical protein